MTTKLKILSNPPTFFYEPCILTKKTQHISYISSNCKDKALVMVHTDFIRPIIPMGYNGSKYCQFFIDNAI